MTYIVAVGKILFGIGAILIVCSIFPRLWSRTKNTEHGVNSCLYEMVWMQGTGASLCIIGGVGIFLPILLPMALKVISILLELIASILGAILGLL